MAKVEASELAAFCPYCGAKCERDAKSCSQCGKTPKTGGTELKCPSCGFERIYEADHYCLRCGAHVRFCWVCRRQDVPVVSVELGQVTALIIWIRISRYAAFLCRTCGEALYRQNQKSTLVGGWWSIWGPFMTPYRALANYSSYRKIRKLPS